MRRIITVAATVAGLFAVSIAAVAAVGTPEVDRANVTFRLNANPTFVSTSCPGEDGVPYTTFRGGGRGKETEVTPGFTDYNLTGPLTVSTIEWTINMQTFPGVLTSTATLRPPSSTARIYSGPLKLITQGFPTSGAVVAARGWLAAPTYTGNVRDGGAILANVEVDIDGAFGAFGGFGDVPALF